MTALATQHKCARICPLSDGRAIYFCHACERRLPEPNEGAVLIRCPWCLAHNIPLDCPECTAALMRRAS